MRAYHDQLFKTNVDKTRIQIRPIKTEFERKIAK